MDARLAVIGGSGLYSIDGARVLDEREVPTPWGLPSDMVTIAEIAGERVAFLPRHGRGHRLLPSEVPSRANIWALKSLGVEQILSVSAVGSLSESIAPGDFVLSDGLVDKTTRQPSTYLRLGNRRPRRAWPSRSAGACGNGIAEVISAHKHPFHPSGTYVCMEGPAFSTRAESRLHKSWGAALIGMTALPEARLAREAEICYATVAMVTDWDCWKQDTQDVTVADGHRDDEGEHGRDQEDDPRHGHSLRRSARLFLPARGRARDHDRPCPDPVRGKEEARPLLREILEGGAVTDAPVPREPPAGLLKAATVAIVGRPSAGKSTLVNRLCGNKVSIVSAVPQTTRNRVRGILTTDRGQIVFFDTPGFHLSEKKLNVYMSDLVSRTIAEVDIVLYVVDGSRQFGAEEQALVEYSSAGGKTNNRLPEQERPGCRFLGRGTPEGGGSAAGGSGCRDERCLGRGRRLS